MQEPKRPTLPSPPEIPELFPGFGKELESLASQGLKTQQQLIKSQRKHAELAAPVQFKLFSPTTTPPMFGFQLPTAQHKAEVEKLEKK